MKLGYYLISTFIVIFMLCFAFGAFDDSKTIKAAPEFNHPKMVCDFIYYNEGEQNIIRRCYDEQNNVTCYISEYLNTMSCVPGRE
jgi:hypothetical protein